MYICKYERYSYTGNSAEEAYRNYLFSDEGHDMLPPNELQWFQAVEMKCGITLTHSPAPKEKPATKAKK